MVAGGLKFGRYGGDANDQLYKDHPVNRILRRVAAWTWFAIELLTYWAGLGFLLLDAGQDAVYEVLAPLLTLGLGALLTYLRIKKLRLYLFRHPT